MLNIYVSVSVLYTNQEIYRNIQLIDNSLRLLLYLFLCGNRSSDYLYQISVLYLGFLENDNMSDGITSHDVWILLKPSHTIGKVSVNASILYTNQEICNKTNL